MKVKAEKITRKYIRDLKNTNILNALKETDIYLEPGTLTAVSGRSGSGKSTLLNVLSGLIVPSSGSVLYDDTDIFQLDDLSRSRLRNEKTGIIPQVHTGIMSLTVEENILLPFMMYDTEIKTFSAVDKEELAGNLMERMGILSLKDAYPNELSGGEMRRLSIARALIRSPEIIFADEPTGDLDDENTHNVFRLLREFSDNGKTVFLVTHEKEAFDYADITFRMSDGKLEKL